MNYANIETRLLNCSPMNHATDSELGVWLRLLAYCGAQENGGKIHGADKWTARQWLVSAGVEKASVEAESPLWHFTGVGTLIIVHYPISQQDACQKQRASVRRANLKRWSDYRRKKSSNDSFKNHAKNHAMNHVNHQERKGKEKKKSAERLASSRPI